MGIIVKIAIEYKLIVDVTLNITTTVHILFDYVSVYGATGYFFFGGGDWF